MPATAELLAERDLLANLTLRELRGKYKRSALGWGWSMVNPIATLLIYAVVFGLVLNVKPDVGDPSHLTNFACYLTCGLLPWNFLGNCLGGAVGTLVSNGGLIKKVYFPRSLLPTAVVLSWDVSFLIELGLLCIALLIFGNMVLPWIPVVLAVIVLQTAFALGVSLMLSALNVYFRDIQHLIGVLLQVWFFATPIVYSPTLVRKHGQLAWTLYRLNPMYWFVSAYRNLLYDLRFPTALTWGVMTAAAAAALAAGIVVFRHLEPGFAEEL